MQIARALAALIPIVLAAPAAALAGDGTFPASLQSTEGAGDNPSTVAVGDFNADGNQDLVVANFSSEDLMVRLGDGTGEFTAQNGSPFAVDGRPSGLVVADFDSDGDEDVASANTLSNAVSVRLGDGFGGLSPERFDSPFAVGAAPRGMVTGDFNRDGRLDLATANIGSDNISVLLGDGDGDFPTQSAGSPYPAGDDPAGIALADVNGDGSEDLLVANVNSNNVTVRLGDQTGAFPSQAPGSPHATGTSPVDIAVGDFNRDGNDDLATVNRGSRDVTVRLGDGSGGFANQAPGSPFAAASDASSITVGDYNSDEIEDLAIATSFGSKVVVLLGDGAGGFAPAPPIAAAGGFADIATADIDRDGNEDLALAGADEDEVLLLRGAGTPSDAGNLLINGGGEAASGMAASANFGQVTPIPGWTTTGTFSNHRYGSGEFPRRLLAARYGGQEAFFTVGALASGESSATQTVDLSAASGSIDSGLASVRLSGYIGGWRVGEDTMTAVASFTDASGAATGPALQIGPVTRVDRASRLVLLPRSATGAVPPGTRSITVTLTGRHGPSVFQNTAYADRLGLFLNAPGPDTGPPPPPETDTTPPETQIDKQPKRTTEKPKAKLAFSSNETEVTFECSLKGRGVKKSLKAFAACPGGDQVKYKGLADGKKKFRVRAVDAAGNVDPSPAKGKWRVE